MKRLLLVKNSYNSNEAEATMENGNFNLGGDNVQTTNTTVQTMFDDYDDVVTVCELSKMLRVGRNTAYNMINSGQITYVRVGNQIRIPKSSIIEFVNRQ